MTSSDLLQQKLDTLPAKPGCYLYMDSAGKVIYVGKAVNLRNRVRSYFHETVDSPKTRELVKHIADLDTIIVGSELEALILEMNLIKKHRPKYNVRLKDDKRYPYIKVHYADPFPKVTVTRRMDNDGSRYFGPYTSVWAVHQTLDVLRKIFPYLTCDRVITGHDPRACLFYDIKLCIAPCIGASSKEEYRAMIDDLCRFLRGHTEPVVARLKEAMLKASEALQFEKAGVLRDQLVAIERVVEKQKVITAEQIDSDVIAFARSNGEACVQVFFIRAGKLIGREYFVLEGTEDESGPQIVEQFVKQFYDEAAYVPPEVLLPDEIEEARIINEWLNTKRGGEKVTLTVPRRGMKRDLIEMAAENAAETLAALKAQWEADTNKHVQGLAEVQTALGLAQPPNRIECFDISNTQGTAATASMVVFEQGAPKKAHYRRFIIKSVEGPNDFASMKEALTRRFRRWREGQGIRGTEGREGTELSSLPSPSSLSSPPRLPGQKQDESFSRLPDLLIIDGGKGQLGVAVEVLKAFEVFERVPVCGLAKQQEEIFLPGKSDSILLPRRSQGLFLVQRVRDEAHRFALTHHRTLRGKIGLASQLDAIPGIGPARRKALLKRFGSLDGIRDASLEELASVRGMTREAAQAVKESLG
ncbi:MAG: excinuclease ABC subunit C [Chloroflexi bacterium RBG_16_63_12]|nr:MAG: excinuclease ABC subunit C [Chloroflexi bacterium RBG_16_63_12]